MNGKKAKALRREAFAQGCTSRARLGAQTMRKPMRGERARFERTVTDKQTGETRCEPVVVMPRRLDVASVKAATKRLKHASKS